MDLFVTAARIAGVEEHISSEHVIDGIERLPLVLDGEGNGHRNYLFHYSGKRLVAVRMDEHKLHLKAGT